MGRIQLPAYSRIQEVPTGTKRKARLQVSPKTSTYKQGGGLLYKLPTQTLNYTLQYRYPNRKLYFTI